MQLYEKASAAALEAASAWYESQRNEKGGVNTNVMTSGIAVAELLRTTFPLTAESVKTKKEGQVKGLSGGFIKQVLEKHGETRKFTVEGGRTSRGTLGLATSLALLVSAALEPFGLDDESRIAVADELETHFVNCIQQDYFNKKRLDVAVDFRKPVSGVVADILNAAKSRPDQATGAVAQHLVGAKLELRFPDKEIGRDRANAADQQTDRQGDFQLGTTAFHVTMAPSVKLADRARENLLHGFRPVMLVPEEKVSFAHGLFESEIMDDQVGVQSIETFVGTNIEEMGSFDTDAIKQGIVLLIRRYNERIAACESDQSLRIKEPAWMTTSLGSPIEYGVSSF
ncbi:DUF4928 family protein [Eggerthella guodeyinii]|uniref:DUF4928 family protein n=1 Tax=Eggerthella guodeyinii TaxID=2690837 RepID=UPI001C554354|nr:DUF4928 family protein [Eggerthella guodeyinii]